MAFLGGNPMVWRIGFAVAWLVGSWLFGPKQKKNEIFDPGAEEMPRWNTALRGITMPVLFGTNRVSSQVTWEHDYTVVRNEGDSGGGGKIGGSGGGKGGATGNEGISYDYYWDFIFHIGMVHEKVNLSKVWLGSERIANDGVAAIVGGSGGTIIFGEDDEDTDDDERTVMKFEDAFFYSGSGAALGSSDDEATYDAWSEITSDMGLAVRWPHTTYVGFKQLHLGQFPGVPQFSWEIGPIGASVTYDTAVDAEIDHEWQWGVIGSSPFIVGDNGTKYLMVTLSSDGGFFADTKLYSINTSTGVLTLAQTYTAAEIEALVVAYSAISGGFQYFHCGVLDPLNYIAICGVHSQADHGIQCALAKINSSGALEIVGYAAGGTLGADDASYSGKLITLANNRTSSDPILFLYNVIALGLEHPEIAMFPSPSQMLNQDLQLKTWSDSPYNGEDWVLSLTGILGQGTGTGVGRHGSYRDYQAFWWQAPYVSGLNFGTKIYGYIGQADVKFNTDNPQSLELIDDNQAAYPNGFVFSIDFGVLSFDLVTFIPPTWPTSYAIANNDVKEGSVTAIPFDNRNLNLDGTTNSQARQDYDPHPFCHKLTTGPNAGTYVLIFSQSLPDDGGADCLNGRFSSYIRGKVFYLNLVTGIFQLMREVEFEPFDRVTDLGQGASDELNPECTMLAYLESSQEVYFINHLNDETLSALEELVIGRMGTLEIGVGGDVTPPEIIYQILTSDIFGIGVTAAQIDQTSYTEAVTYCNEQEFKISFQCRREAGALSIIDDLLSCYGGFLVIANGIIYFKQLEYLNGAGASVRTIDNDHLIADERGKPPVQVTKGARQDTFNKVKVNYFDRSLEYAQNQVEEGDEVDQDLNGMRAREFPALFVMNEKMARTMAVRALWANLYSRDTYTFKLGWKDHDLAPGDCITLIDSYHNALQGGVTARIIEWKEQKRGEFEVTAKQEFEYIQAASAYALNITSESVQQRLGGIPIIRDFTMYELPAEYQMGNVGMAYVSWATHRFARGASLWMSTDGTTYAKVQVREPYQISGVLLGGLPAAYDGDFNENVEMLLSPRTAWNVSSPDYYFNQTLPNADQAGRAVGTSLLWCGSEMMAYQGVTLVAQNRYRFTKLFRGWGGTNIHAHNSGDTLYKHGGGVFYQEYNEDKIGTKVSYKVQPYNLAGHYQDISSIAARSYTIVGRHYTPQIPPSLRLIWPDDQRAKTTHFVNSAIDIPISWERSAQKSGYGAKGYGAGGYGDFTADSQAFRVQVYGSGGVVVRSLSVSSTYFNYDASMNAADNGAWRGNVAFKVTPYNQHGDALKTSVISLELW